MPKNIAKDIIDNDRIVFRGEVTEQGFIPEGKEVAILHGIALQQFIGESISIQIRPRKRQFISFNRDISSKIHGLVVKTPDPTPAQADRKTYE